MKENICLVTGGFDPLHRGHIEYFKSAKKLSNYLIVGVNSDDLVLVPNATTAVNALLNSLTFQENLKFITEILWTLWNGKFTEY